MSSATVFLKKNDSPKSPRKILPNQIRNWLDDRLIEAEARADQGDLLGVGIVARDDGGWIARRQAKHQEHEDRDDEHHRDRRRQPAQDIAQHRARPFERAGENSAIAAVPPRFVISGLAPVTSIGSARLCRSGWPGQAP